MSEGGARVTCEELAARQLIQDRIHGYAVAYDEGDFEALADVFWPEAVLEFTPPVAGLPSRLDGRDDIVGHLRGRYERTLPTRRRHLVTNTVIRFDGDRAHARSYLSLASISSEGLAFLAVGRYEDELHRRAGFWRFSRRTLQLDVLPT